MLAKEISSNIWKALTYPEEYQKNLIPIVNVSKIFSLLFKFTLYSRTKSCIVYHAQSSYYQSHPLLEFLHDAQYNSSTLSWRICRCRRIMKTLSYIIPIELSNNTDNLLWTPLWSFSYLFKTVQFLLMVSYTKLCLIDKRRSFLFLLTTDYTSIAKIK